VKKSLWFRAFVVQWKKLEIYIPNNFTSIFFFEFISLINVTNHLQTSFHQEITKDNPWLQVYNLKKYLIALKILASAPRCNVTLVLSFRFSDHLFTQWSCESPYSQSWVLELFCSFLTIYFLFHTKSFVTYVL